MGYAAEIRAFLAKVLSEEFGGVHDRMGRAVGATGQQIRRWAGGQTSPTLEQLGRVLDRLGVTCSPFRRSADIIIRPRRAQHKSTQPSVNSNGTDNLAD